MKKILGLMALSFTALANGAIVFSFSGDTARAIYENYQVEVKSS